MGAIEDAKAYALKIRESADDGSDFSNPPADYRMLFLGEDGQLHVKDSAGTVTDIGVAGGGSSDPFGFGYPFTADPGYAGATAQTIGSGVCRYMRVIGGGAITKVGLHLAASGGNIAIAHYSASGSGRSAVPSTRLATTGAIASPGTGYQEVSLSTTLTAGDFLAISADSNTPTVLCAGTFSAAASGLAKGRNFAQASSGHPCPNPAGTLDAGDPITYILIGVA